MRKEELIEYLARTVGHEKPDDSATESPDGDIDATFEDLSLSSKVMSILDSQEQWRYPTPIQAMAIPYFVDLEGSPAVWAEAPTGSGKTAAYVLPMLHHLLEADVSSGGIDGLILSPTRELADQIGTVLSSIRSSSKMRFEVTAVYGGVRIEEQIQSLTSPKKYPHVVVATLTGFVQRDRRKRHELGTA